MFDTPQVVGLAIYCLQLGAQAAVVFVHTGVFADWLLASHRLLHGTHHEED